MRAIAGRPVLMQRHPQGATRGRPSSRSGCRRTRPSGCGRRSSRRPTARRPTRWSWTTRARRLGGQPRLPGAARLAVGRGRAGRGGRAADRPRPVRRPRRSTWCARRPPSPARCSASSGWTRCPRRRATAASTSTCGSRPSRTRTSCARRRSPCTRARAPAARSRHRRVVEGGARRPGVHRLQPERAAQDGVRGVVGARAGRRAGVDAVLLGRARDGRPRRRSRSRRCPGRVAADGDPWDHAIAEPQPLAPLLELHERDMRNGLMDAPWPPVYPKMPNEPPRVAPSRARKPVEDE